MTEDLNRERANAESVFTLNRRAEFVMTAHFADLPPWIDWSPSALAEEVSRPMLKTLLRAEFFLGSRGAESAQ